MPGDLHTHTTFSDGSTPAAKLPFLARCAGMTHLALSDHDSMLGVRYAYAHPTQEGVHLIPAVEMTAYDYERATGCIFCATGRMTAPRWRSSAR